MSEVTVEQALVGLAVAVLSASPAWLAYRISRRKDAVAEQAGIATAAAGSIDQVVKGLNDLVENLQKDNQVGREAIERCANEVAGLREEIRLLVAQTVTRRDEDDALAVKRTDEDAATSAERQDEDDAR